MITGLLLGLTLPPGFPLWMAFLGGAFGMAFGKLIFGGLGQNIFNPALLGRAFLQAAFPVAITTWPSKPESWWTLQGDNLALPFMSPVVDAATGGDAAGQSEICRRPGHHADHRPAVRHDQRFAGRDLGGAAVARWPLPGASAGI